MKYLSQPEAIKLSLMTGLLTVGVIVILGFTVNIVRYGSEAFHENNAVGLLVLGCLFGLVTATFTHQFLSDPNDIGLEDMTPHYLREPRPVQQQRRPVIHNPQAFLAAHARFIRAVENHRVEADQASLSENTAAAAA